MNENTTTKATIGEVRFSYCHLFTPEAVGESNDKKYSVVLIIPKNDSANLAKIEAAYNAALQAGIAQKFGGKKPLGLKSPLRDGDEMFTDSDGIEKRLKGDEFQGCYYLNAKSNTKPGVVKRVKLNGENKLVEVVDEQEVYSGCYGFASINFYAYNNAGNRGIGVGLNNILKTRDGDFLGGRSSAQTDFGGIDLDAYDNPEAWEEDLPE